MHFPTKGSLSETSFIGVLKDSAAANLTGMIRLENGTIIKVVYLQGGSIAFASSNEKADRLTEVLKRAEKLTPEQVEDAQARLKPNVSLGKTLVELGYISARDLLWGARAQVEGILHKLLFWKDGSYQVLEGPLPKEIISLNLSVAQIIYDGVLTTKDREWLLNEIGSPEAVFVLGSDFHEKNAIYKLPADSVVSLMDGKRSLEEIAQQSGLDTFETCKIAAALQQLGLIEKSPDRPVQLEFPEATPVTEIIEDPIVEELAPTVIQTPPGDVSLGQVLHVPTMDELESDGHQAAAPTLVAEMPQVKTPPPAPAAPTIKETAAPPIAPLRPAATTIASAPPAKTRLEPPVFVTKKKPQKSRAFTWLKGQDRDWTRIVAIAMIPIALGVAGWVYYSRTRPIADEERLKITPTAPPITSPEPKQSDPAPVQETKQVTAQPVVIEEPTPEPAPPAQAAVQEAAPITMARLGKLPQAAISWKQQLTGNSNKFTIQLVIACQEKTVFDALQLMEYSQDILVVPMNFKGRPCYRVLYGIYRNTSDGRVARNDLPNEFLNQPSPPQVVSIGKILR